MSMMGKAETQSNRKITSAKVHDLRAAATIYRPIEGCPKRVGDEMKGIDKIALACSVSSDQDRTGLQLYIADRDALEVT